MTEASWEVSVTSKAPEVGKLYSSNAVSKVWTKSEFQNELSHINRKLSGRKSQAPNTPSIALGGCVRGPKKRTVTQSRLKDRPWVTCGTYDRLIISNH